MKTTPLHWANGSATRAKTVTGMLAIAWELETATESIPPGTIRWLASTTASELGSVPGAVRVKSPVPVLVKVPLPLKAPE